MTFVKKFLLCAGLFVASLIGAAIITTPASAQTRCAPVDINDNHAQCSVVRLPDNTLSAQVSYKRAGAMVDGATEGVIYHCSPTCVPVVGQVQASPGVINSIGTAAVFSGIAQYDATRTLGKSLVQAAAATRPSEYSTVNNVNSSNMASSAGSTASAEASPTNLSINDNTNKNVSKSQADPLTLTSSYSAPTVTASATNNNNPLMFNSASGGTSSASSTPVTNNNNFPTSNATVSQPTTCVASSNSCNPAH